MGDQHQAVTRDVLDANLTVDGKRKLSIILRARCRYNLTVFRGDMVEVYVKRDNDKHGKWSSARVLLKVYRSAWTVTVPVSRGNTIQAAVEDVRLEVDDESYASHVRDSNDALDDAMSQVLYQTVGAYSHSVPALSPERFLLPVPDLSCEGLSDTMVRAGIGTPYADTAYVLYTAAVSRPRHPVEPPVTRSVSQAARRSGAPSADRPPAQALDSSSVDQVVPCNSGPLSSLPKELVLRDNGRKSSSSTPVPFNYWIQM